MIWSARRLETSVEERSDWGATHFKVLASKNSSSEQHLKTFSSARLCKDSGKLLSLQTRSPIPSKLLSRQRMLSPWPGLQSLLLDETNELWLDAHFEENKLLMDSFWARTDLSSVDGFGFGSKHERVSKSRDFPGGQHLPTLEPLLAGLLLGWTGPSRRKILG